MWTPIKPDMSPLPLFTPEQGIVDYERSMPLDCPENINNQMVLSGKLPEKLEMIR